MVHTWFTEFRCGRISTSDVERPGRPKEVTSQEMMDRIHDIVLNDRRLKVREISDEEAVCKMVAAFAHSRSQAGSYDCV